MAKFLLPLAVVLFIWGCSEDEIGETTINLTAEDFSSPQLGNDPTGNGGVLSGTNSADTFEIFSWMKADFGASLVVQYTGEISDTETFENTSNLFVTTDTFAAVTNGAVNAGMLGLGLEANAEGTFYLRIRAKAEGAGLDNLAPIYSDTLERTATTFVAIADPLYLIGGATAASWNNPASPVTNHFPLFPSLEDATKYSFTGRFLNDGFKIIQDIGSWGVQWGLGSGDATSGTLSQDGGSGNLGTGGEGYFTINIDSDDLTYTIQSFDESGAADLTSVGLGITGAAAGGWDEFPVRFAMTQSSFDKHMWYATGVTFTDGEFKFKQNSSGWGTQFGASGGTGANSWPYDKANGGDNLVAKAGTYTVFFNDLTKDYWMIEEAD
jgi:hypothetical protein